jgi:hypothetical protein
MLPFGPETGCPGPRRDERLCPASCRLGHRGDWIIPELSIVPSRITINTCQQQRGEAVPNYNVLHQLVYRDLRRSRAIP